MSTSIAADAPYGFDIQSPAFLADPYPVYARLREAGPIVFVEPRWIVSGYAEIEAILRHPSIGRHGYELLIERAFGPGPLYDGFSRFMLFKDPPDHTRLRGLTTRAFTPRAVERMRGAIQARVDRLLDELGAQGGGDLVSLFAYPLPVLVICDLLGVPPNDRAEFRAWSDVLGRSLQLPAATPQLVADGNAAAEQLTDYFCGLVAEHRVHPRDDLLGALVAAEDESGRLSEEERLATAMLLFVAGHETTVNLIGNGTLALLRQPDQWRRLRDDPDLARQAVEEVLRYESPVQIVGRVALADLAVGAVTVRAGEILTLLIGSANRDPSRFEHPDRLDIRRSDLHHLSFAAGPHYCLGAALARVEAEIAFTTLVRRFPDLRLVSEDVTWRQNAVLRGVQTLLVAC
jgi:cytochrome P450